MMMAITPSVNASSLCVSRMAHLFGHCSFGEARCSSLGLEQSTNRGKQLADFVMAFHQERIGALEIGRRDLAGAAQQQDANARREALECARELRAVHSGQMVINNSEAKRLALCDRKGHFRAFSAHHHKSGFLQ
jgi:hypothetical protein